MKDIHYSKIKSGLYAIEENGEVYSYTKKDYMKTSIDKDGYVTISLKNQNNGYSHFGIHRLLMIAYKPVQNMEELTVNHIDGNKLNNSLDNLEWCTASENTYLAHKTNLNNTRGEHHGKAKLSEKQAKRVIQMIKEGKGTKEIRKEIPFITKNIVNSIKHNRTWKHLPR